MDYLLFLQNLRESCPGFVNTIFVFISEIVVSVMILIPALVYWCSNKKIGLWMLLNYSGAYLCNQIIKNTACVYRPWIRDSRLHVAPEAAKTATGYSFPSGHTTIGTSVLESVAIWQKNRKWVIALCSAGIVLIAFCRNWLGAHTFFDVTIAVLETSGIIIINILIVRGIDGICDSRFWKFNKVKNDVVILVLGLIVCTLIMLFLQFKNYPLDTDSQGKLLADPYAMLTDCYTGAGLFSGLLIGWFLERRIVHFKVEGTKKQIFIRGLIGALTVGLFYLVILPGALFCLEEHLKHFIKYFILMLYVTFIYPALFWSIQNKLATKGEK